MLLPSTHLAAILLLVAAFVCLGSWANTFKAAGWRFELFSYDFAIGAIIVSAIAAWTLGTLGSELSFNDRIAVAGLRSQAFAMGAGFLFSLGNVLLIATMSLIGMTAAFPLAISIAFVISSVTEPSGANWLLLSIGCVLMIVTAITAASSRWQKRAKVSIARDAAPTPIRKSTKGLITGIAAGLLIGGSGPLAAQAFWGDLGLGAYAGMLMFCIGLIISTVFFNFFFLNMAIEGSRLSVRSYFRGSLSKHLLGVLGGAMWAGGMLCVYLAVSAPKGERPESSTITLLSEGSVLLAMAWGAAAWKEFARSAPYKRVLILVTAGVFILGLLCLAFGLAQK